MGRLRDLLNGGAAPAPVPAPELKQGADPVVEPVVEVEPVEETPTPAPSGDSPLAAG
jgi:hypothetical protein